MCVRCSLSCWTLPLSRHVKQYARNAVSVVFSFFHPVLFPSLPPSLPPSLLLSPFLSLSSISNYFSFLLVSPFCPTPRFPLAPLCLRNILPRRQTPTRTRACMQRPHAQTHNRAHTSRPSTDTRATCTGGTSSAREAAAAAASAALKAALHVRALK